MFRSVSLRRGGTVVATAALGISGLSLAFAGTAGASSPAPVAGETATLLVGSGSQTTYAMMTQLGDLFNQAGGCDLTASAAEPLDLNCAGAPYAVPASTSITAASVTQNTDGSETVVVSTPSTGYTVGQQVIFSDLTYTGTNTVSDDQSTKYTKGKLTATVAGSANCTSTPSTNPTVTTSTTSNSLNGTETVSAVGTGTITFVLPAAAATLPVAGSSSSSDSPKTGTCVAPKGTTLTYNKYAYDTTGTTTTTETVGINTAILPTVVGASDGAQGFAISQENPFNDYTVQASPVGSGNGATQLNGGNFTDAASGTDAVFEPSYARASSAKGGAAQNEVAYAVDGVSWTAFAAVNGVATPASQVANISVSALSQIWNDTLATVGGVSGGTACTKMTWGCLGATGAAASAPIACYDAQSGSGTESTWSSKLGYTKGAAPCAEPAAGASAAHLNNFENTMSFVATQADAADAIYFMSYGKFTTTCSDITTNTIGVYTAKCAGATSDLTEMGQIAGSLPNQSNIQADTFAVSRALYNIYNNNTATGTFADNEGAQYGPASGAVPAGNATLNFVGENGFLCKPSTLTDIDPSTGNNYRTDIENIIEANGFFPIDPGFSTITEYTSTTLPHPGQFTGVNAAAYGNIDPVTTSGFCVAAPGGTSVSW